MRPEAPARVELRASLASSEDPGKVLAAVEFVLGEVDRVVEKGARQVKVRAETALGAFTTPSSGGWIMFGKEAG